MWQTSPKKLQPEPRKKPANSSTKCQTKWCTKCGTKPPREYACKEYSLQAYFRGVFVHEFVHDFVTDFVHDFVRHSSTISCAIRPPSRAPPLPICGPPGPPLRAPIRRPKSRPKTAKKPPKDNQKIHEAPHRTEPRADTNRPDTHSKLRKAPPKPDPETEDHENRNPQQTLHRGISISCMDKEHRQKLGHHQDRTKAKNRQRSQDNRHSTHTKMAEKRGQRTSTKCNSRRQTSASDAMLELSKLVGVSIAPDGFSLLRGEKFFMMYNVHAR